jgi:NodT family efflux transporter outer membrane factor (OMF) lipoprotein
MNTFDEGISANWDLDLFGRLRRTLEASRAEAEAVEGLYRQTKMTVVANTVRAYTDACSVGAQIDVGKRTINNQEESRNLVEKNVKAGRGTPLDLSRANALLAQLKASLPPLEAQKKLALFRLATLMGKQPHEYPKSAFDCKNTPQFNVKIPVGDGAKLIARRPDVLVAERRLAGATASIGVATASLYPSITFGASMGLTAHETDILGKDPSERFSIGPLVSWSVPNVVAARARIKMAEANTRAALANFDGTILNALRDVESALASYTAELDRNAALTVSREENLKSLALSRRLLKAGVGNFLDVLDVERSLANADAALAASDAAVAVNRVILFLSLGGGWE